MEECNEIFKIERLVDLSVVLNIFQEANIIEIHKDESVAIFLENIRTPIYRKLVKKYAIKREKIENF